ncbi:hypothetical protein QYE76_049229 [Lolium multiflorum]|uniref:Uncharacterized protein n=1 Tax=Lolium multiflorum TaxID=4521 RepID=A0AAD8SNI8_LOLMU|nr:hypothetical protein QYE76_049229 [Lolium multiflorum]
MRGRRGGHGRPPAMSSLPATSAPSRYAGLATSRSARKGTSAALSTRYKRLKGSPRVQGDEEEEDVDDLDNEFNYKQDNGKGPEWQLGQGQDLDLSSSSRHEPHHRIPRLTNGKAEDG